MSMTFQETKNLALFALENDVPVEVRLIAANALRSAVEPKPTIPVFVAKQKEPTPEGKITVKKIIAEIQTEYKLKKFEIAQKIGVSPQAIGGWQARGKIPSKPMEYLIAVFPDIDWNKYGFQLSQVEGR